MAGKMPISFKYYLCDSNDEPIVSFIASKGKMDNRYLYLYESQFPLEKIESVFIYRSRIVFSIRISEDYVKKIKISIVGGSGPAEIKAFYENIALKKAAVPSVEENSLTDMAQGISPENTDIADVSMQFDLSSPVITDEIKKEYFARLKKNPRKCPHCGGMNLAVLKGNAEDISGVMRMVKCMDCTCTWRPAIDSLGAFVIGLILIIAGLACLVFQIILWDAPFEDFPIRIFHSGMIVGFLVLIGGGIRTLMVSSGKQAQAAIIAVGTSPQNKAK
ncbi:MAG: hypothetical protein HZA50_05785 [Planctomycetes bacterium]|nr:hypothetical protein [Planctomycetota bacterium]